MHPIARAARAVPLLIALVACGDAGQPTIPATAPPATAPLATAAPATSAPPTSAPATTVPPATAPPATAAPATTAAGEDLAARAFGVDDATNVLAERLEFPGSTLETVVSSAVVRGERVVYFVEAPAGWLLAAGIGSVEDNAVFDLYAPTGERLLAEATAGHVVAPEPGDYQIVVGGTRGNATYDLAVALSPAEVVRFDAGATGTTIADSAPSGTRNAYLLGAAAGQTMSLAVTSQEGNASLAVRAPSGEVLQAGVTEAQLELTEDGDYVVLVGGSPGGTTFELEVTITG